MNSNNTHPQYDDALLLEVLQPRATPEPARQTVYPVDYLPGTPQARAIEIAASQVREVYHAPAARRPVPYDAKDPSTFLDGCGDLARAALDVQYTQTPEDAAIALAVIDRAVPDLHQHRPTRERTLVEIQMLAIETARKIRLLFAQQQSLEMA